MWTHRLAVQHWPHPCSGSWLPQSTPALRFERQAVQHNIQVVLSDTDHLYGVHMPQASIGKITDPRWQLVGLVTCHSHQVNCSPGLTAFRKGWQHECCTLFKACMCWLYHSSCNWHAISQAAPAQLTNAHTKGCKVDAVEQAKGPL